MAFQNTLLRHIHVTLGLRHPWLRTVLEGHPPQAPHTTQLYSMSSQGNSVEYSASSLHPAHSSVQYSGREFHPHPDNCQSPPQDSLPATNAALGMENDWCNSPPHPARSRQTGSPGGNWRPGKSLPAPDTPPGLRRCPETRCRRSEEHTSELQSRPHLVCRLLLEKKKTIFYERSQLTPPIPINTTLYSTHNLLLYLHTCLCH